jgi:hypothetical protein
MVHKRMQRSTWDYGNVFNFSTGTSPDSYYNAYNISYHNDDGDDVISASWTTSRRDLGAVTPGIMQLLTIDNNNTTGANGIQWYLGGQQGTAVATTNGSANTASGNDCKIVIGGSHEDIASDGGYSFTGDVQELIILKRNRMSDPFLPSAELSKIHSYLAVKYGLTLTTDYVASNGTTVWNRTASGVYNNHIFGIARDNDYGLYQKQSQSASASLSLFTAFVGNNVAILNSSNTSGLLDNNVYAMFGSNGQNFNTYTLITNPSDQYTVTGSTEKLNYRSALAYRLQVTGSLTMKFKPTANVAVPEYMLISTNQGFPADATTEVIPFLGAIPEKYFSAGVYYISFAGHMTTSTQGPGGVSNNLMLWLRADDETSVVTELLPVGDSKISGYPDAGTATVVSALSEWKDLVRNKTYSYAMGGSSNNHLEPVYQPSNYMTNFHPAVRFWGSSNVTWLGNTSGIWTTPFPANNKHSAFFVVNNNFGTHQWIYTLMFGSATTSSFNGPGYGVHKLPTGTYAGNVVGRFRTTGDAEADGSGTLNLFTPGATSILGYHHEALGQASNDKYNIKWRFNGLEDSKNGLINGAFGLNQASMIGRGFALNRTIQGVISEVIMYDGELSTTNMELVESYLALKYGITLTPTTHAGGRFDYRFSDGTMLWNGTAGAGTKWNTYYNRIAAVIRDDNANLHNRQSHSTNVGSILHMGVAGTRLGTYVDLGYLEHDREAVIWGDDGAYGSTAVDNGSCSSDEHIFNRKWRVCKITKDDRPVRMLVGAEDNSTNQLGQGASVADLDLFGKLKDNYDVSMIVLDPDDPDSKTFQAVVPMTYIDGEHQCAYTFTDSVTYITFGYKEKPGGGSCRSEVVFDGTKVFDWSQWTRTDYANLTKPAVDLGDGVQVTGTKVTYDGSIIIPPYYPSVTNTPVSQSLYIQRRSGSVNSEVTVTIEFNTPVRPEFSIYDIDGYAGCLEKVSITGECGIVTGILPGLSYGGDPLSSYYTIYIQPGGATAMASVRRDLSPTDSRGRLNVSFQDGVKKIIIKYSITDQMHRPSVANNLIVSPIRIRQIPPSPPRNEEGLSFVKDVDYRAITTCDHVGYSFYIENVVCESKYVNFLDTLPENMKWKAGISMDNYNANNNTSIKFNDYEGKRVLRIDSLLVPSSGALILTASATLDDDAIPVGETRRFNNHAWLKYEKADMTPDSLSSLDRETLVDETYFDATWLQRQDTVETKIETNRESYSVDDEITAILTVNNPNDNITDSYLEILYDAGFEYIAGSFRFESETPSGTPPVVVLPLTDSTLLIAGETGNLSGFTIPQGISTFTFKLRAPAYADLVHKLDENNQATNEIADLTVDYSFLSDMNDPCVIISLAEAWGTKQLPYKPVAAYNDSVSTFPLIPVRIDVMANDFIPKTCTPELDIIEPYAKHGTPVINPADSSFTYTPTDPDFSGVDSIRYYIKCGTDSSAANVYILVQNPLSMKYVACAGASVTMGFRAANGVQYYWYDVETGGNIVADGNSANTLSITKGSAADISTWWVEPRYGSVIFPRYRVDLEQSDNCGTANPVGCAATGTVIWSDDFGGNYNSSSQRASDPGWTGDKTTYTYVSRTNYWLPDVGEYALLKSIAGKSGHVWSHSILDDHTSWNDPNSGYFLTFDANQQPGEFYNFEIDNLCEGSKLTFTAWLMNINPPGCSGCAILPNTTFIIEDMSGNVLSIFYTGDIDKTPEPAWVNYSFDFVVPSGVSKLKVRFFNNQSQSGGGNDISIDDIEVRLCTPQVTMNISDITVCSGTTLDIVSTYIEDCTFGDKLAYKFEFRHIDSVNWKPLDLDLDGKTVDCDSPTEADRKLEIKWTIPSIRSENEGYYRMTVSSPANIDKVNCSASSDSVYVKVVGTGIPADIRIDVCPLPDRPIRLSSYLDSLAYNSVSWTKVGVAAPDILNTQTGEISSGGLTSTYTYRYSQTSQCGTGSAIAYVYPLKKRFQRATDTIVICKDEKRSRDIHIGHILGLNLNGGTWTYDSSVNPDNTLSAYMKIFPTSSSYEGALVFDAYKAWENTSDAYKVPRSGDANAKKFVFRYIAPAGNCIETQITKNIVIIITEKAF